MRADNQPQNVLESLESRKLFATTVSIGATIPVAYRDIQDEGLIVVTRGGDLSSPLEVPLTVSGTAVNGVDYGRIGSVVTIPAGQRSVGLPIRVGASPTASTYVRVSVNADPDLKINSRTAVVSILQNPSSQPPVIRDFEVTANQSVLNARRGVRGAFVITRNTDLDTSVTVPINVGGTATNGTDFGFIGDSVTFLPGQDTVVLPIRTPGTFVGNQTIDLSVATGGMTTSTTFNLTGVTGVSGVAVGVPRIGGFPGAGSAAGVPLPGALPRDVTTIVDTTQVDTGITTDTSTGTTTGITPTGSTVERVGTPMVDNGYGVLVPATRVFG